MIEKLWNISGKSPLESNEAIMAKKKRKLVGRPEQPLKIKGEWSKAVRMALKRGKPPKGPKKGK
jgi:hypothetical protein